MIPQKADGDVLDYILTVFPPELALLEQLAQVLRQRNSALPNRKPLDAEPVVVTALWMRRVVDHARRGELDIKGVFELSACLSNEMPKVLSNRDEELRSEKF